MCHYLGTTQTIQLDRKHTNDPAPPAEALTTTAVFSIPSLKQVRKKFLFTLSYVLHPEKKSDVFCH